MSDAKRTKNYIVYKLRKNYREGKLDTSQVARLKAIGFDFDGTVKRKQPPRERRVLLIESSALRRVRDTKPMPMREGT